MPQTDHTFTADELRARVAEALDIPYYGASADGAIAAPVNTHDADKVDRAIRDGLSLFYAGTSIDGGRTIHTWSFLLPQITLDLAPDGLGPLNIDADPSRYRLPWYIQSFPIPQRHGDWHWHDPTGNTAAAGWISTRNISDVDDAHIRGQNISGGRPLLVGIRPTSAHLSRDNDVAGYEFRVYPDPDVAYQFSGQFRVQGERLLQPTQKHIAGATNNDAIFAACVFAGKRLSKDESDRAYWRGEFDRLMQEAAIRDLQQAESTLGVMEDADNLRKGRCPNPYSAGLYFDGVRQF